MSPIVDRVETLGDATRARFAAQCADILSEAGPMLAAAEVAELLGISEAEVEARRARGQLLAVPVWGAPAYPAFQFVGGAVVPGLESLLAALAGTGSGRLDARGAWATLDALVAPDESLGGISLADALRAGDTAAIDRAIRLEQADGFA